jgi:RecJ-like exonuclease
MTSTSHPFGWDLPPGCSYNDIDLTFGDDDLGIRLCPDCKGSCFDQDNKEEPCSTCKGKGEIEVTPEQIAEEAEARRDDAADHARDIMLERQELSDFAQDEPRDHCDAL